MTEEMNTNPSVSEANAEIMTAAAAEMHTSSEAGENAAAVEAARAAHPLRVDEIKEIIPHRYPFLLIDQVVDYEPGKFADIIVLEEDPYKVKTSELTDIKVDYTFVGGKLSYSR